MHPKYLSIGDFNYDLPEKRIAEYPLEERSDARLLIYEAGLISQDIFLHLSGHLPPKSLLVFNNSKTVKARFLFQKPSGAVVEIFCLQPHQDHAGMKPALLQQEKIVCQCLVGGASKWKHGQVLEKTIINGGIPASLRCTVTGKMPGYFLIEFSWSPSSATFSEILNAFGETPLPPYIKRKAIAADAIRYQTIYAQQEGSVAAPTAGLHFTKKLLDDLESKRIETEFLTLHVGAGTFKPVRAEIMEQHEFHAEYIEVTSAAIRNIKDHLPGNIVAVGTTSIRTIESLFWLGTKTNADPSILPATLQLGQWEPYETTVHLSATEALSSLLKWMETNRLTRLVTKTQLMIAPGYPLKIVTGLITNFHQPRSTLLLLVAAFIGADWKKIYEYALNNDFRFLSYGDVNLLWNKKINGDSSMEARQ